MDYFGSLSKIVDRSEPASSPVPILAENLSRSKLPAQKFHRSSFQTRNIDATTNLNNLNGNATTSSSCSSSTTSGCRNECITNGGSMVDSNDGGGEPIDDEKSMDRRLLDLVNETKFNLVQRNGQRIYGGPPPDWKGKAPGKGCEIFVGKVPRDCFEDELVPIFERIGPIYELRLMMDFSGSNRGYLFVRFTRTDHAKRAVKELNNFEIRPNKYLGVLKSVDNRKLWISGIPKNRTAEEVKAEMEKMTDGVINVILYQSHLDKSKTRGYAFVEYESHRDAALARRQLVPGRIFLFGHELEKVDWAEPEMDVEEEVMSTVKILFIRNLANTTTEEEIRDIFESLGAGILPEGPEGPEGIEDQISVIEKVKKIKDYAFVHFNSREAAERALKRVNVDGLCIADSFIEVNWSKPVDKQNHQNRKTLTKMLSQGTSPLPHSSSLSMNGLGIVDNPMGPMTPLSPLTPTFPPSMPFRGAPGTMPPRRLVKMLNQSNGHGLNPNHPNPASPSSLAPGSHSISMGLPYYQHSAMNMNMNVDMNNLNMNMNNMNINMTPADYFFLQFNN